MKIADTSSKSVRLLLLLFLFFLLAQTAKSQDARYGYISPVGTAEFEFGDKNDPSNTLNVTCTFEMNIWTSIDSIGNSRRVFQLRFYNFNQRIDDMFIQISKLGGFEYPTEILPNNFYTCVGSLDWLPNSYPAPRSTFSTGLDNIYFERIDTATHNISGEIYINKLWPEDWFGEKVFTYATGSFKIETIPPQLIVTNSNSDILKTKDTAKYQIQLKDKDGNNLSGFDVKVKDPFVSSNEFFTIGKTNQNGMAYYNRIIPNDAPNGDYELTFWATKDTTRAHQYWDTVPLRLSTMQIKKTISVVDTFGLTFNVSPEEPISSRVGNIVEYRVNVKIEDYYVADNADVWVKNKVFSNSFEKVGSTNSNGEFLYKFKLPDETELVQNEIEFFVSKEGYRQSDVITRYLVVYPKGLFLTVLPSKDLELFPKDSTAFIVYVRNANNDPISGADIYVLDSLSGKKTFTKVDTTDLNGRLIYSIKIPENASGDFHYKFFAHKEDESTDTIARKATVQSGSRCWTYAYGMLEFCIEGNGKWETEEGKPILKSENAIVINDFLIFEGNLEIDTVNLSMKADGKFYLKEIPLPGGGLGSFTVAEGSYQLAFAGPDGKITNFANAVLEKVAGFDIKITDLQLVGGRRADGIKFSAKMSIPGIAAGCNEKGSDEQETEFDLKDLEISKTKGVQLGGFNVQNLGFKSFPNFCIKELSGSYDDETDKLAYGANVKIPFGEVGGGLAFSKGKLDSVGFRLEAKFPPLFVIGTSTVGIMGFFGHISNITKPEIEFELGGVLSDITSESLYKIDMSGYYKSPSTIGMKGDGTIFKDPLTDKWQIKGGLEGSIDFAEYQMEIIGNINVGTKDEKEYLLKADANMKYNMKQSKFSGAMSGTITLPKFNNGWPYDWINSTLGLPKTTTASARLIYGNMKTLWGDAYFPSPVGNLRYVLDLKKSWGDDDFFFFERSSPSSKINVKVYDGDYRILNGDYTQKISIGEDCEKLVVRITGNTEIPVSELLAPDGTLYKTNSLDPNNLNIHYATSFDEYKSFWTITNPSKGDWKVIVKDVINNFTIDNYIFDNPPFFRIETQQNQKDIIVSWETAGLSETGTIDLFLDNDTYGENGVYLKSVDAKSGTATISINDSLSHCKYFVYAVYLGKDYALSSYSEKPVLNTKSFLHPPANFTAKFNTTTGKYTAEWTASQDNDVVGYVLYSVEDYGGYEQVVASAPRSQSKIEFSVPSHQYFKVKIVSFDKNGLMGCPTPPQQIIVGVSDYNLDRVQNQNGILLSPNPASEYIEISLDRWTPSGNEEIKIYNTFGELVISETIHPMTSSHRMNIKHLLVGLYLVRIGNNIEKFVVVR